MGSNSYNEIGAVTRGAFAGDRFTPWTVGAGHDGWAKLDSSKTAADFLTAAGLDFKVHGEPLTKWAPYGLADEHKLIIGNGKVLGVHSPGYGIVQNADVAEMLDLYTAIAREEGQEAAVHSMFSLNSDKVVAGCTYVGEPKRFGGGHGQHFMTVANAHDGSMGFIVWSGLIISECTNTLSASMATGTKLIKIRHTSGASDRVEQAKSDLMATRHGWMAMDDLVLKLVGTPMTDDQTYALFRTVLPKRPGAEDGPEVKGTRSQTNWDNRWDSIVAEWKAEHNEYARGTAWGAVMAVNGYELWGGRQSKTTPRAQKQYMELASGDNGTLTERVLALVS